MVIGTGYDLTALRCGAWISRWAAELDSFCIIDPHTMTAVWHDQLGVEENKLLLLTYAPEDVVLKEEIQFAMLAPDFTMQRAVANFNKQSGTHLLFTRQNVYDSIAEYADSTIF